MKYSNAVSYLIFGSLWNGVGSGERTALFALLFLLGSRLILGSWLLVSLNISVIVRLRLSPMAFVFSQPTALSIPFSQGF